MHKYRDTNGAVNYHLTYQAAWFMDWVCQYMPIDIHGQSVDQDGYRKKPSESKRDYWWYECFKTKPPGPYRDEYFAHALESFWIPAWWYNNKNVRMTTAEHEKQIKVDQQEFVDDLWAKFLSTGRYDDEKGYDLSQIPERLHVNWGKSCLAIHESSVDPRTAGQTAAADHSDANTDDMYMARPVSPPPPGYRARSVSATSSYVSRRPASPRRQLPIGGTTRTVTQSKSRSPAPPTNRPGTSSSSSWQNPYLDNRN